MALSVSYEKVKVSIFSADGNYEVSYQSNVMARYTGEVLWVPPAIYKSSCRIDVEYFPFDEQVCTLVFGKYIKLILVIFQHLISHLRVQWPSG